MIQKMFAIRDAKAQAFLQPFFSSANGSALRALGDAVADGKSPLALHPEDYMLYEVATFDDQTAEIVPVNPIKLLACAADFAIQKDLNGPGISIKEMREALTVENGKK